MHAINSSYYNYSLAYNIYAFTRLMYSCEFTKYD